MSDTSLLQRCAACGGQGNVVDQRGQVHGCPVCHDTGVALWWGGRWWTWQHPINDFSIYERGLERSIRFLISALLLSFAVIGIGAALPFFYQAWLGGNIIEFLSSRSWMVTAAWVGILCALYLFYRFERQRLSYPRIPAVSLEPMPGTDPWSGQTKINDAADVFSEPSLHILDTTWRLTKQAHRAEVSPVHLLATLSFEVEVASMLVRAGLDVDQLRQRLVQLSQRMPEGHVDPLLNSAMQDVLCRAFLIAAQKGQDRVHPPHLMAAIAQIDDPARELLYDMGVDDAKLQHIMAWLLVQDDLIHQVRRYRQRAAMKPKGEVDRAYTGIATPLLDRYSTDLTHQAKFGQLPYVVGRDEILKRMFRIIEGGRRSVVLVGENGVGKTNILYALAQKMVSEDVPELLQDKRLVSLSASALVAGAEGLGGLEGRMEAILDEVIRSGNIVLAIEHLDQLAGVSSTGSSGMDLSTMLAQPLSQHLLLAVATAETADYRRTMERGPLLSAFEKVEVPEMNTDQAILAIESRLASLEQRYRVFFSYDAIAQAVSLSQRYIHDKTLPGKAWELLEEAGIATQKTRGEKSLVTGQDVAQIVTERTKITVTDVTADEQEKLLHLEEKLHQRIVGQEEAVKAVSNALRRARAELRDANRPIANLLFLGPTGVGKTELAKTVAEVYFGSEDAMIRLDMSEYQEVSSINRLIGAPPGFTGSGSGGYLTEAVRNNPFCLVLLDELEKAHPDILNVFLQVMDDGRLTDGTGRTIDFTNVIMIATSNAGTQHIQDRLKEGMQLPTIKNELMNTYLQKYFRPEFLNRFDSIIVFTPLNQNEVEKIVGLMVNRIAQQLSLKGISLQASDQAIAELAQTGFDPSFGARPLRRAVQENVDNALAQFLLQGKLNRRDVAVLEPGGVIRVEKAQAV